MDCGLPGGSWRALGLQDFDLESIRKVFKFSIVRDPVAKFESGVHEARRQNSRLRNTSADEMLDLQLDLFARTVADGRCPTRKVVNGAIPKVWIQEKKSDFPV